MGVRLAALSARRIGKSRIYPESRAVPPGGNPGDGPDFGCGSSREGAVWSLQEMGIRAIIGSGFGDIFFANCFQNGILPIAVDKAIVDALAAEIEATQGAGRVSVDLEATDDHLAVGTAAQFRDRSATARRPVAGVGRGGADIAARRRNPELSGCRPDGAALDSFCKDIGMSNPLQHGQNRRCRRRGYRPRSDRAVASYSQLVCRQARRPDDIARSAIWFHSLSFRPARCCRRTPSKRWTRPTRSFGGQPAVRRQRKCRRRHARPEVCCRLRSKYDLYANLRPIVASPALADSAPLKAEVLKGVDFVIIRELHQRHLFRRAARHRNACRRPAAWFQHRAVHHQSNTPGGARCLRIGANEKGQGLLRRQGECAGNQRGMARGGHRAHKADSLISSSRTSMSIMLPCRSCGSRGSST